MHDFTLTEHLLDRALKDAGSRQIARVNLMIGPFSEEREESIRLYWKDLAKGSCGEGAELHFEHLPFEPRCLSCAGASYLEENVSVCEFCGSKRLHSTNGGDVRLESIELK